MPLLVEGYNKDGQRNKVQLVLSLITSGRVPLWYRPWDGNQTDNPVYLADMTALRETLLATSNAILIGDRKLCNAETMVTFCRQKQLFIGAHPWTETAKAVWQDTWQALQAGRLTWSESDYVSRNNARKPPEKRPRYQVCEVVHELRDEKHGSVYPLRWVFIRSSDKAQQIANNGPKPYKRAKRRCGALPVCWASMTIPAARPSKRGSRRRCEGPRGSDISPTC